VGGTCSTHEGGERCLQGFVGRPEGKNHWEDIGVAGRITLRWTLGINVANWIRLAQDRVQWRACVGTVMNLRVP
jgi:hypothetical protein